MKIDKVQIKIIIGLIFVIIMYCLILFLEHKENINDNEVNENIDNQKEQTTFIDMQNIEIDERESLDKGQVKNITKEELFSLIEKGTQTSDNVELFIYSTEIFNNDNMANVFYEGEYEEIIGYINLSEYKGEKFEFMTLRNTESYIWGYFIEEDKELTVKLPKKIWKKYGKKYANKNARTKEWNLGNMKA